MRTAGPAGRRARLVLVEDNLDDVAMFGRILAKLDLKLACHHFDDAELCLNWLQTGNGPHDGPLLVVLDLNMPGMDGREFLAELRADPRLRPVPVVVLTTSRNGDDIRACYSGGANAYHIKPLEMPAFEALLRSLLDYWLFNTALPGTTEIPL